MLYYDPRLSKSGFISCNSCHNIATFGVDNLPTSIGHKWSIGPRNAPTVLNAALHVAQFWDGRAKDVEEQAQGPIVNPKEMAIPHKDYAVKRIASIPEYVELFKKAFPGEKNPVNYENIAKAIAAFERTLMTPSRFDKFLKGDLNALTPEEKKGLRLFIGVGCARNVTRTYPYFHDGSVWDLREAVRIMAKVQLNKELTDEQINYIVAFLESLTGEIPKHALELPVLPPSTDETPKPEFE